MMSVTDHLLCSQLDYKPMRTKDHIYRVSHCIYNTKMTYNSIKGILLHLSDERESISNFQSVYVFAWLPGLSKISLVTSPKSSLIFPLNLHSQLWMSFSAQCPLLLSLLLGCYNIQAYRFKMISVYSPHISLCTIKLSPAFYSHDN